MTFNRFFTFSPLALAVALAGCSSSNDPTAQTVEVSIPFEATANNVAIACETPLSGLGTAGSDAVLKDFRFYIHDVTLTTDQSRELALMLDDNDWQADGVALVDFQNVDTTCDGEAKSTHTDVTGSVTLNPGESVTGLAFKVGIPSALNHQNQVAAEAPFNLQPLFWSWQTGYKFMRLDVAPTGGITRPSDGTWSGTVWNVHLGSTNCSGDPTLGEAVTCARSNRPQIVLADFDPTTDTVVVDYGVLVEASNLGQDDGGPAGCMSGATDPECAEIFNALGLDLTTGAVDESLTQTVFRRR